MPRGNPNWKKGKSGNPSGRPKGFVPFRSIASPEMGELAEAALLYHLKRKNAKVLMWFYDQIHGKAPQAIEVTGRDGEAIQIRDRTTDEIAGKIKEVLKEFAVERELESILTEAEIGSGDGGGSYAARGKNGSNGTH